MGFFMSNVLENINKSASFDMKMINVYEYSKQ